MDILMITIAIAVVGITLYYFQKYRQLPPGPWGVPILGYLPFLNPQTPYKSLQQLSDKYGSITSVSLGMVNTILLSDAAVIRETLKKEEFSARAPLYVTHGIMGGNGIICAEGILWKDQRRQVIDWLKRLGMTKYGLTRNVLEARIKTGVETFLTCIERNSAKRLELDPFHGLHHSLGNLINDLVFGITYEEDDVTWKYLQNLQEEGVKLIGVSGVVNFLPFLRFLPSNQKTINFLLAGKRKTHQIYDEIIKRCSNRLAANDPQSADDNDAITASHSSSILEYFLKEKSKRLAENDDSSRFYTEEQLRHLLADMFGAGVDTSLTTLRWFFLYMAKWPKYQTILQAKLSKYTEEELNLEVLESIDLLRACLSETQRIRSVVPLGMPHGTMKDSYIGKYKIPKNSMIIPFLWAVHMDPKVWPDPEEFNPFRFLNSEEKYYVPSQFIAFQSGKRICPGEEMAKMILLQYTGKVLHKYRVEVPPFEDINMEGDCGITLTPPIHNLTFTRITK